LELEQIKQDDGHEDGLRDDYHPFITRNTIYKLQLFNSPLKQYPCPQSTHKETTSTDSFPSNYGHVLLKR
jgi:hypothetical protein